MRRLFLLVPLLFILMNGCATGTVNAFTGFITRNGHVLEQNGSLFRFGGSNIHYLGSYFSGGDAVQPANADEDTGLADAQAMNASAIRAVNIGISVGCPHCLEPSLHTFNDAFFAASDYALQDAATHNLRVIIPLAFDGNVGAVHGWEGTWTGWEGLVDTAFFTSPTVKSDVEEYISHVLNHVNVLTGVAYKNDPTIMVWEIGNEIRDFNGSWNNADSDWVGSVGNYIKGIAPNQLIGSGHLINFNLGSAEYDYEIAEQGVGLYTQHYYNINCSPACTFSSYQTKLQKLDSVTKAYGKAAYIGEFDWTNNTGNASALQTYLNALVSSQLTGDFFWQLVPASAPEANNFCDKYCLHYPFPSGDNTTRGNELAAHAASM